MRFTHPHSPGLQSPTDGVSISVEPAINAGQRPVFRVQTLRLNDVVRGEPLAAQGNTLPVKVSRDGRAVDTEPRLMFGRVACVIRFRWAVRSV